MDPQSDETGFVPAGPPAVAEVQHRSIFHRRWPKAVGAVGALTLTAALGLQFSHASHAAAKPAAQVVAIGKIANAQRSNPWADIAEDSGSTTGGDTSGESSSSGGGIHGTLNLYDGFGGGVEFWFDPATGKLTIAIGAGVGEGGDGSLGYYTPGTEPETGVSGFVDLSLGAGTVGSFDVSDEYNFSNGKLSGSISETIMGRTVTLNSDGTGVFDVNVVGAEGAEGFEGRVGAKYAFSFTPSDVLKIIEDIWDWLTDGDDDDDDYWDDEEYDDLYYIDDGESDDVTGDDTTVDDDDSATTTDDSSTDDGTVDGTVDGTDGSSTVDSSSDDGGDSGGGDGGGGGGGGGGGCDEEEMAVAESVIAPDLEDPCEPEGPEEESYVLTVHADHSIGYAPNSQVAAR